jgi:hypothetical protein
MITKAVALLSQTFRVDVRQLRTHVLRGAVAAGVLWLLAVIHLESPWSSSPGRDLCEGLSYATVILFTLMGAFYFPSVITEEKEEQTLGLLRMAGVNSVTLLLGKSVARLGVVLLLVAVSLPYWWLCVTLGGVTTTQVAAVAMLLSAHLILMSQVGTFFSVLMTTTGRACVVSSIVIGLMVFGVPIVEEFLGWTAFQQLRVSSPVFSLYEQSIGPWCVDSLVSGGYAGGIITVQVVTNLIASVFLFAASWMGLERLNTYEQAPGRSWKLLAAIRRRFPTLGGQRRKPRRAPEGGVGRAIAWKDFLLSTGGYRWWLFRFAGLSLIATLFLFESWGTIERRYGAGLIIASFWTFIAEVVFQSAHFFHRELKQQTWETLRMLPMSTGAICWRKLLGTVRGIIPTVAVFLFGMWIEETLYEELWRESGRETGMFFVVSWFVGCTIVYACCMTSYFGMRVNPWLGSVISAGVFFFTLFSILFCAFDVFRIRDNPSVAAMFFFAGVLHLCIGAGFVIPIMSTLNGETKA